MASRLGERDKEYEMDKIVFDTPLCEMAYKYGSDKCPQLSHQYTPRYWKMFSERRNEIKKVLEIGVACPSVMVHSEYYITGASLYMWRDFFPNAMIYGADILPQCVFRDKRIQTFLCDQSKKEDLVNLIKQTGQDINIVVDDGSHVPEHQIISCLTLMPYLPKDVTYIIEDVTDTKIFDIIRASGWDVWYKQIHHKKGHCDRMCTVTYPKI